MSYLQHDLNQASEAELRKNLDWQKALMEHYDDNFDHRGYANSKERAGQLEAELRKRGLRP